MAFKQHSCILIRDLCNKTGNNFSSMLVKFSTKKRLISIGWLVGFRDNKNNLWVGLVLTEYGFQGYSYMYSAIGLHVA